MSTKRVAPKSRARVAANPELGPRVLGVERLCRMDGVKPNGWNPNHMSKFELESAEHTLRTIGWVKSMLPLVWGKDDRGKVRNLILDGEHRWKIGKKIGFKQVPMVFVDGLSEPEAKRLSILIRKHGHYDRDEFSALLMESEVRADMDLPSYSLMLGIEVPDLDKLLKAAAPEGNGMKPGALKASPKITLEFSSVAIRDAVKKHVAALGNGNSEPRPSGDLVARALNVG